MAGNYDGSRIKLYVNGSAVANNLLSGSIDYDPKNSLNNGGYHDSDENYYFDGMVDDVRIWSYARSQAEIQAALYTELNGNESGLVGYWKLNEGSGTTTADATANNVNGTLTNGVTRYLESTMPVELTKFATNLEKNKVQLTWQTTTEVNNYGFEIERAVVPTSSAANALVKIGLVAGHGNSNSLKDYTFIDADILTGMKYS